MRQLLSIVLLSIFAACGTNGRGDRCNPNRATSDCNPGLSCVFPATPGCNASEPGSNCCGNSFCCATDGNGNVTDTNPNCQPDPVSVMQCGLDFAVAPPDLSALDAGHD